MNVRHCHGEPFNIMYRCHRLVLLLLLQRYLGQQQKSHRKLNLNGYLRIIDGQLVRWWWTCIVEIIAIVRSGCMSLSLSLSLDTMGII